MTGPASAVHHLPPPQWCSAKTFGRFPRWFPAGNGEQESLVSMGFLPVIDFFQAKTSDVRVLHGLIFTPPWIAESLPGLPRSQFHCDGFFHVPQERSGFSVAREVETWIFVKSRVSSQLVKVTSNLLCTASPATESYTMQHMFAPKTVRQHGSGGPGRPSTPHVWTSDWTSLLDETKHSDLCLSIVRGSNNPYKCESKHSDSRSIFKWNPPCL